MKYRAVILVNVEVHTVDQSGTTTGQIIPSAEFSSGVQHKQVVLIDGNTKEECLAKVKSWLNTSKNNFST